MKTNQLTGVILSGGRSSRMGSEKGLVSFRGKPLISYAVEALNPVVDTIIISANEHLNEYRKYGYEIIQDEITGVGPMGGLISALKHSKTEKNMILSCDMPFVNTELLDFLNQYSRDYEVVVPVHTNNKLEPLCGLYSRSILSILEIKIREGNYKLRDVFNQVHFKALPVDNSLPFYRSDLFYNVNAPKDLNL